jgi:FkbM family methyltransferase
MAFLSYAQNFEDVMLWRALSTVRDGFYIDVGAGDPDTNNVTRAFYERGWRGVNIEPDPARFDALIRRRDRDINLPIALAETTGKRRFHVVSVPGLSTLDSGIAFRYRARGWSVRRTTVGVDTLAAICRGHAPATIHFLKIDVEGAEGAVLQGADFVAFRPWIVLAEATLPLTQQENHASWEPILLAAGYCFVWFDGLNRFYIAEEKRAELSRHFRLPPNCFDMFAIWDPAQAALAAELQAARAEVQELRARLASSRTEGSRDG